MRTTPAVEDHRAGVGATGSGETCSCSLCSGVVLPDNTGYNLITSATNCGTLLELIVVVATKTKMVALLMVSTRMLDVALSHGCVKHTEVLIYKKFSVSL